MADPTPPGSPAPRSIPTRKACEACQRQFPQDYLYCPLCARTLRDHADTSELALPMGMPRWFNRKALAGFALLLVALVAFGLWRLSQIPATPPPQLPLRAPESPIERRFASDLAEEGHEVRFRGPEGIVVQVDPARWSALGEQERFARHALVGDFRRLLATRQRELNDQTPYRLEVRDRETGKLLAEETDFNLKVYP